MYPTSPEYKDAVYAPSRRSVGRVTFDISDVSAVGDVTSIVTTPESSISDKQQLISKVRKTTYNLATLEPNRFRLDGSYSFADDIQVNNGEVGFVSDGLCGPDGVFATQPTITVNFGNPHSSIGLTITFDHFNREYATEFNVSVYDASSALIESIDVVGNTDVMSTPMGQLYNYKKVVVTIKKWSVGERRVRILEIDFGVVKIYTDDNLISMGLIEELDLTSSKLPSAEFSFKVDNLNREFNILNPTGFYRYLQERQQVIAEIGIDIGSEVEYIPLGNYLLTKWTSDEGALTASFTAGTNLDLMASFEYENSVPTTKSLYQLAVDLFAFCGISNYSIDPALASITTNSLLRQANCKNILQLIAIAGCANIFVTRSNVIMLKVLSAGAAVDDITLDNVYSEPQIELGKLIKSVNVKYWSNLSTSVDVAVIAPSSEDGEALKMENNTLINTSARATIVGTWILAQMGNRGIYRINWRGNPAHELGDIVTIENGYGASLDAHITRNELTYEGYLSGRMEAKGAVN